MFPHDAHVRLERAERFVELQQHGDEVDIAFGRTDAAHAGATATRIERFATENDAAVALADHVRRLERKRYRVGCRHPELEAAIVADIADPGPRLVLGDWLIERGDPRGELIARMAAGRPYEDLLAAHPYHLGPPPWLWCCRLEWHLGFVRGVTIDPGLEATVLPRLFRHPSFMVVEELDLRGGYFELQSTRWALQWRPRSLRRIDARRMPWLAPLADEIPGFAST